MKYRLLIDYEVIEFFETLSRKDQRILRNRLLEIQDYPNRYSDYTEHDSEGRRVDIHICGKYAIKFWEDHADKHLKILNAHLADKPHSREARCLATRARAFRVKSLCARMTRWT